MMTALTATHRPQESLVAKADSGAVIQNHSVSQVFSDQSGPGMGSEK